MVEFETAPAELAGAVSNPLDANRFGAPNPRFGSGENAATIGASMSLKRGSIPYRATRPTALIDPCGDDCGRAQVKPSGR